MERAQRAHSGWRAADILDGLGKRVPVSYTHLHPAYPGPCAATVPAAPRYGLKQLLRKRMKRSLEKVVGRVPLRSPHSAGAEASTEQSEDPIPEDAGDHVSRSGKGCRYEHRCKLAAPICQECEPELLAPSPNLRGASDSFPEGSGYEPGFEPAGRHLVLSLIHI